MAELTLHSVIPLFASPVLHFTVPDAEALNAAIVGEVAAMRAASPGVLRSNQRGWHSATDFFQRPEPGCAALRGHILQAAKQAIQSLAPRTDLAGHGVQAEGWINVNGQGAFNTPHDHSGFTFAGSYYVTVPEPPSERSGMIEFLDTRTGVETVGIANSLTFTTRHRHQPKAGDLLLFPGWLRHWVYPNEAAEDRISIAFNLKFTARPKG